MIEGAPAPDPRRSIATSAPPPSGSRRRGIALVTASAVLWSTAGLLVRVADLDAWTLVAWSSGFACLTLAAVSTCHRPQGTPARGIARAARLLTVANVMAVYACGHRHRVPLVGRAGHGVGPRGRRRPRRPAASPSSSPASSGIPR